MQPTASVASNEWLPIAAVITATGLLLWLIVIISMWLLKDAKRRGKDGWAILILCLLTAPLGFLVYMASRPVLPPGDSGVE
jgi:hypothetical protein